MTYTEAGEQNQPFSARCRPRESRGKKAKAWENAMPHNDIDRNIPVSGCRATTFNDVTDRLVSHLISINPHRSCVSGGPISQKQNSHINFIQQTIFSHALSLNLVPPSARKFVHFPCAGRYSTTLSSSLFVILYRHALVYINTEMIEDQKKFLLVVEECTSMLTCTCYRTNLEV
jgi:hypothetical protein